MSHLARGIPCNYGRVMKRLGGNGRRTQMTRDKMGQYVTFFLPAGLNLCLPCQKSWLAVS